VSADSIPRFIHTFIPTLFVLMAVVLDPALAQGQTTADLFNPDVVQEIRLSINSRDYQELRERYQENTYYTADLSWHGLRVRNVGVRNRGIGSRNPIKLGLRVDFDRYTTGQTFLGLRSLILDNNWQDPSLLAERAAMALVERLGEPAPRESYCRFYINNVFQGLYSIVENVDARFLARAYDSDQGYLFHFDYAREWHGEDLGDDLAAYLDALEESARSAADQGWLANEVDRLAALANRPASEDTSKQFSTEAFLEAVDRIRRFAAERPGLVLQEVSRARATSGNAP
jgi:spore coat protein CotH